MTRLTYISSADIVYDAKNSKLKFMVTLKTVEVTQNDASPISTKTVRIPVDDPQLLAMKFITQ
jgi:hypothetical protein